MGEVMIFQPEKLLWMLCFGFVSGHDFSRAVKERKRIGLQPLRYVCPNPRVSDRNRKALERLSSLKFEDDRRSILVDPVGSFFEAALGGNVDRGSMLRVDDAHKLA
jgi:hypothetical protein